MKPKKIKLLIQKTAELTGSNEKLIDDFTSYYWNEIRKSMVEMKGHRIFVEGFGTFYAKERKVLDLKKKFEEIIASYNKTIEVNKMTYQKYAILKDLECKLEKVINLEKIIQADKIKKLNVKEKRYGITKENNTEDKNNLAK